MASNNGGYWSRSWELLTRDEGWHKPLLVLAAARLIPIVGTFGADGYGLEWARLTAWGVDSSPKQRNVDVGACIKAGARAFVVALGYLFVFIAIRVMLTMVLGEVLGGMLGIAVTLAGSVITLVAKLRATIYQRIGAGYQVERIYDMVRRDLNGLLRIFGLIMLLTLGYVMLSSMLYGAILVSKMAPLVDAFIEYDRYGYGDDWMIISALLSVLTSALPFVLVMSYVTGVVRSIADLISVTSVGLWMRQFDVAHWGDSSDPLPSEAPAASSSAGGYAKTSADWHAPRQDVVYDEPTAPVDMPGQADEPAMVYPIPVARDDFQQSSAEMEQLKQREDERPSTQTSSEDEEDASDTVKTFQLTHEDDEDVREVAESPVQAHDIAHEAYGAAEPDAPEPEVLDEVPMFSLDSVAEEPEPEAPSAAEPLTHDELLAQAEAAIRAADMTTGGARPHDNAADLQAEDPMPDEPHDAVAEGTENESSWRIVEVVDLTGSQEADEVANGDNQEQED